VSVEAEALEYIDSEADLDDDIYTGQSAAGSDFGPAKVSSLHKSCSALRSRIYMVLSCEYPLTSD
jgi:hypothetical protein